MKYLAIGLSILSFNSAFALQVGDTATYDVSTVHAGIVQSTTLTYTVTSISGDEYTIHQVSGDGQASDTTASLSSLGDYDQTFNHCGEAGTNSFEEIAYVNGVTIPVCSMIQDGRIGISVSTKVSLRLVKLSFTAESENTVFTLKSFKNN